MVSFFACGKNVTKPPLISESVSNAMVSWNENEDTVLKLNQEKYNSKTKMKEKKTSYISKICKDVFHPVLFKSEGTSPLRTSLKKNI